MRFPDRDRAGWWVMIASIAAAVALAAVGATRPTWLEQRFVILYVAPTIAAAGVWLRTRITGYRPGATAPYAIDAVVFILAAIRSVNGVLPFSGHMLFFTYSLVTTPSIPYRLIALAILIDTTWFKLIVWDDPVSWSIGLGTGLAAAAAHAIARKRTLRTGA